MINLLPPEQKRELILEKNKRLVIILGNIGLISLVCLILIILSIKFYILGEIIYQKSNLDNFEQRYQDKDFVLFKKNIQDYNTAISKINNFYSHEVYFNDILKNIIRIERPSGLYFTGLNISRQKEDGKIKIVLSGISDTRDNLLIFRNNIEKNEEIKNVYFPPNNWVKPKDINFNFSFEAKNVKNKSQE